MDAAAGSAGEGSPAEGWPTEGRDDGWRGFWNPRRGRLWLAACAVAAYLPALGMPFRGWLDFSAFYAAGHFAFTPQVTQLEPIVRWQFEHGLPITPFVYPAWLALGYVPFSWLPYDLAAVLHIAEELAFVLAAAVLGAPLFGIPRRWAVLGALAWAPAAAGVVSGQNTGLALLLAVLTACGLEYGRPWLAGVAGGVLLFKPQLAVPVDLTLAWRGLWRVVAMVLAAAVAEYLLGVLAAGGDWGWPANWLASLQAYNGPDFLENGWQAISLPSLLGRIGVAGGPGSFTVPALLGYALGGLIVLACLPALRSGSPARAVALACAAGLVVSPHAWVYDATLLLPAMAVYAADAGSRGWPWQDRWILAAAYALAVSWPLGGLLGKIGVALPIVVVLAPFALLGWRPFRRGGRLATAGPAA